MVVGIEQLTGQSARASLVLALLITSCGSPRTCHDTSSLLVPSGATCPTPADAEDALQDEVHDVSVDRLVESFGLEVGDFVGSDFFPPKQHCSYDTHYECIGGDQKVPGGGL